MAKESIILKKYADQHGLKLVRIRYKHQFGYCKRRGYDLVNENNHIILSIEPVEPGNYYKDRWYFRNTTKNYTGKKYFTRICKSMLKNINPLDESFFVLSETMKTLF